MAKSEEPGVPRNRAGQQGAFPIAVEIDTEALQKMEAHVRQMRTKLKPHIDAIDESERLSERDFSIRINTRA